MSSIYTMTLQELIEEHNVKIFNFDYDLENIISREELEQRFINKYYFREICYESYSMWKFKFMQEWKNKLFIYNDLFKVWKTHINPFLLENRKTIENMSRLVNVSETDSSSGSAENESTRKSMFKDTPITEYDNSDYVSSIENIDATDQSTSSVEREKTKDSNIGGEKEITQELTGNQYEMLMNYTNTLIDIVERFINEFNSFFIGIFR